MAIVSTIAGPYSGTYDPRGLGSPSSVGETEDGFRLRWRLLKQMVTGSPYGQTAVDAVGQGMEVFLSFTTVQADLAVFDSGNAEYAWPTDLAAPTGKLTAIGYLDVGSSIAGIVVLTAASDTTAASAPATLTANQAIVREDFDVEAMLASRLRKIPIDLRLYPYDLGSSVWGFFSFT